MTFNMEYVSCPLCGSRDSKLFRKAKDRFRVTYQEFVFERCLNCELVFQNPRVTPDTVSCFYPNSYFSSRPGRNVKLRAHSEKTVQLKCKMVEQLFDHPGSLLEIGSANGDFLVGMRNRKWNVQGIEVSQDAVKFSREKHNLKIFKGEFVERPDDGERFDAIVMWAVLPHIHNPVNVVSYATSLLAPSGKLIICCANIDSYAADYMKSDWGHLDLPRHYCMWSPNTLNKLFEMTGLTLSQVIYHDDIFKSQLILRTLYPFIEISDNRPGITTKKIVKLIATKANLLITQPILSRARKQKKGGIMTVVGEKRA
jgi:2-polyprenyl-3-methyl-5-hydroxy-6-metoxy-1,4-benzoquinol methylase